MRPATAPLPLLAGQREILERLSPRRDAAHPGVRPGRACFAQNGWSVLGPVRAGRGGKPQISPEKVEAIVHATLHEKPVGETHWSCRSMAKTQGVSRATVQRIWAARGLKAHRV